MPEYTPLQLRLMRIRDERCGGNAAELARRIKKDATYVNRLFYPVGKPGAKGVGLEIMAACNEAFGLPPGYWDGVEFNPEATSGVYPPPSPNERGGFALQIGERELLSDFRLLPDDDQAQFAGEIAKRAATMRRFLRTQLDKIAADSGKYVVTPEAQSDEQEKARRARDLSKSSLDSLVNSGNAVVENRRGSLRKRG